MPMLPRPPAPPVSNVTVALSGGLKASRPVGVLTRTAVTASTAAAISASAVTPKRILARVAVARPESGPAPLAGWGAPRR